MPPESLRAARSSGDTSRLRGSSSGAGGLAQAASRLLLAVSLFGLLGMPADPAPVGAIRPLWSEAAHLRALKSYSAAIVIYEQIAAMSPGDAAPLLAIGEIGLAQRRWPLAEDAFNRALATAGKNGPPAACPRNDLGSACLPREAIRAQAQAGLAAARWGQGDRLRAVALWEEAADAVAQGSDASLRQAIRMRLALAYLDVERPADAEALLRRETAEANNPAAHLYLAMIRSVEDSGEARRELAAIGEGAPPAVAAMRDYLLKVLGEAEAADSPAQAAKSLGLGFVQMEEWQLARAALERALTLDANDAETMAFLGHSEAAVGKPAFAHLTAGVAARPDWPLGHYLLGLYYAKQQVYELAAEEFQTTLRLDPGNAQAQADLARAYLGMGQWEAAEEAFMAAVESAPDNLTFRLALARFYADHAYRAAERGLAAAQAAVDLAPDHAQARELLGWMYFLAGDVPQARLNLESALRLDPELASAYYYLGMIEKTTGRVEPARSAFLHAIDLDTEGFFRDQAQTALRNMDGSW